MLLISSGILLRGGQRVESVDVGLDVHNVIEIDSRQDLRPKVTAILAADRSVESQAAVWRTPLYGDLRVHSRSAPGRDRICVTRASILFRRSTSTFFMFPSLAEEISQ